MNKHFSRRKNKLSSAPILVHYDPSLPLRLAGDASQYGIGAVISQIGHSGEEQPVAYASRTLSVAEQNYSQIEKEALSLIFAYVSSTNICMPEILPSLQITNHY